MKLARGASVALLVGSFAAEAGARPAAGGSAAPSSARPSTPSARPNSSSNSKGNTIDSKPVAIVPLTTVHTTSYDVRVHLDADGTATFEHALAIRVSGGALHSLDLKANDRSVLPSGEPKVESEDGRLVGVNLAVSDDGAIHLVALEEKGWKHGAYSVRFAMKGDLVKAGAIKREGALYHLSWASPMLGEGVDGMRVVFDLPAAPTEPRPVGMGDLSASGAGPDGTSPSNALAPSSDSTLSTLLSTVRRSASRDELEVVRPHVGRGEAAMWEARIDPRALPAIRSPELAPRPLVTSDRPAPNSPFFPAMVASVAALFALGLSLLKERSVSPRSLSAPLLPLPRALRVVTTTLASGAGAYALVDGRALLGAVAIAIACAALARRFRADSRAEGRGPGQWLALRPREAFAPAEPGILGFSSWRGRIAFVLLSALVPAAVWAASSVDGRVPGTLGLFAALVPAAFAAGGRTRLDRAKKTLGRAYVRLVRSLRSVTAAATGPAMSGTGRGARVVPWVRLAASPSGTDMAIDEIRLRILPPHPIPGLVALEMGTAGESLEILVRVRDDSPAAMRLTTCAQLPLVSEATQRTLPGRTADERVLVLEPRLPGLGAACALAQALGIALLDRRASDSEPRPGPSRAKGLAGLGYAGPERRGTLVQAAA